MSCSYTAFTHPSGMLTMWRGRCAARACASRTSRLTPCIATRSTATLTEVTRASTAPGCCRVSRCTAQPWSLAEHIDSRIIMILLECAWVNCACQHLGRRGKAWPGGDQVLADEHVHLLVADSRQRRQRSPDGLLLVNVGRLEHALRVDLDDHVRRAGED